MYTGSAFQVDAADNVATLLTDAEEGKLLEVVGPEGKSEVAALEQIAMGHKIAIAPISECEAIMKFGVVIGIATKMIAVGEWVHLHNCRSQLDERSSSFDGQTGEPGDTAYA